MNLGVRWESQTLSRAKGEVQEQAGQGGKGTGFVPWVLR